MAKVFLFNPYTGTPRHPSDIASDPEGLAIVDDTVPLRAAQAATPAPVEPVAWMIRSRTGLIRCCLTEEPDDERRALAEIDGDTITPLFAAPVAVTPAPAEPPTFARRWRIASDGFGLQRDDEDGCYVHYHDAAEVLHRALAATPAPAPQWQPIETAPPDHFPRLLRVRGLTMQGFRDVAGHWNVQTETSPHWRKLRGKPTHWMPLPPASEGEQA